MCKQHFVYGKRANTEKTSVMLTFSKNLPWNGIAAETDLWREMNFVTSTELYTDGPIVSTFVLFPRHYTN